MLSQFYLLFLFALPSHSFLTQCSNITKIYEIDANIQKPYILRGGENSIWSFREPHGGNLTLEFLSEVKLSTEVCLNTIKLVNFQIFLNSSILCNIYKAFFQKILKTVTNIYFIHFNICHDRTKRTFYKMSNLKILRIIGIV